VRFGIRYAKSACQQSDRRPTHPGARWKELASVSPSQKQGNAGSVFDLLFPMSTARPNQPAAAVIETSVTEVH
jgi:hypothetical protein